MKIHKHKNHIFELNDIDVRVIKIALEYFLLNADENYLCGDCNDRFINLLNMVTKLTDGKSLFEQMNETKKGDDNDKN